MLALWHNEWHGRHFGSHSELNDFCILKACAFFYRDNYARTSCHAVSFFHIDTSALRQIELSCYLDSLTLSLKFLHWFVISLYGRNSLFLLYLLTMFILYLLFLLYLLTQSIFSYHFKFAPFPSRACPLHTPCDGNP